MAIEAIQNSKKLSSRAAAKLYNVFKTTLRAPMAGQTSRLEIWPTAQLLTKLEEKVIVQHILDMEERSFTPRLAGVEDMANYILKSGGD